MKKVLVVLAAVAVVSTTGCGAQSDSTPPIPKTEVKGIVTLDDNRDGNGPVSDVEISNAISNVAADCNGRVMVDRGNFLVTIYCSPNQGK
jgi:hypothetical protein